MEIHYGVQNGQSVVFWNDRDILTNQVRTPNFVEVGSRILSQQAWKPVLIRTTEGFVIVELQDDNWIYQIVPLSPNAENGFIERNLSFGNGEEPATFIRTLRNITAVTTLRTFLEFRHDEVTVYWTPIEDMNAILFLRGSNGNFFITTENQVLRSTEPGFQGSTRIPINRNMFYYHLHFNSGDGIGNFSRFGDDQDLIMLWSEPGELISFRRFQLPISLQIQNMTINMYPTISNPATDKVLEFCQDRDWNETMEDTPLTRLYFVDQVFEAYLMRSDRSVIRLSNNNVIPVDEIPQGITRMLWFDNPNNVETILDVRHGQTTLFSTLNRRIDLKDRLIDVNFPRNSPQRIDWYVMGPHNGPLLELLRRPDFNLVQYDRYRLENGHFVIPDDLPTRTQPEPPTGLEQTSNVDVFNRLALERFLSYYYPGTMTEPDNLGGYQRTTLAEINNLLTNQQITRFEAPLIMQPFSGPPGSPNRIVTFQTIDGRKLFVKAQYNPQTNQLLPPQM